MNTQNKKNRPKHLLALIISLLMLLFVNRVEGQIKIGDNPSKINERSILEIESKNKALQLPRLSNTDLVGETGWKEGMIIYNTTDGCVKVYNGKSWNCVGNGSIQNNFCSKRVLTDQEIIEIGNLHNEFLEDAIAKVNFSSSDLKSEVKNTFLELNNNKINMSKEERENILSKENSYDFLASNLKSCSNPIQYINASIDYVNNNNFNYNELQIKIVSLENSAKQSLSGEELDAVLVYFSVLKKSSYFWMPINLGGSGKGSATIANTSTSDNMATWEKCLLADAIATGGTFIQIGLALCATPVMLTALAIAVGYNAAFSSLAAVIF